eukprot:scaffold53921_cov31-Tisochrysis_lutea.AAC.2
MFLALRRQGDGDAEGAECGAIDRTVALMPDEVSQIHRHGSVSGTMLCTGNGKWPEYRNIAPLFDWDQADNKGPLGCTICPWVRGAFLHRLFFC